MPTTIIIIIILNKTNTQRERERERERESVHLQLRITHRVTHPLISHFMLSVLPLLLQRDMSKTYGSLLAGFVDASHAVRKQRRVLGRALSGH